MATIPVNPERRDPGYLRKKADIGLSNVDNISATDFINTVADDVKIIGNRKITTNKFSAEGKEYYLGILITPPNSGLSAHANFVTGLFKNTNPDIELAQFSVDFSFSTQSANSTGTLGYTIQVPDSDPFLKDLELVFTQVGSILYVTLYSRSLPSSTDNNYFNQIGTDLTEWTEGVQLIDTSENYYDKIKGGIELARVKLITSHTTIQSEYCESLPVYDKKTGSRVLVEPRNYSLSELEGLDYPTINDVPFIARKGMKINNQDENNARNITVPAKHKGSTKEEAGGHDWEVLNNFKATSYNVTTDQTSFGTISVNKYLASTTLLQNNNDVLSKDYGLCKLTKYLGIPERYSDYDSAVAAARTWLNYLGPDDSNVITVGAFKLFVNFLLSNLLANIKSGTSSGGNTKVSYSPWEITYTTDTSKVSNSGDVRLLQVSASRNKKTITYDENGDETNTKIEKETATNLIVQVYSGVGEVRYNDSEKNWEYDIPENKSDERQCNLIVYVDKGKTTECSQIISFTQDGYSDTVLNTTYSLDTFSTLQNISSDSSTQDISYLIKITTTYESGNTTTTYYGGNDVTLKFDKDDVNVQYISNGLSRVTYPENTESSEKTYTLTLTYKTISESLRITQAAKSQQEDTIVSSGYVFESDIRLLEYASTGGVKSLNIKSFYYEIWSISGFRKINDLGYKVSSTGGADWFSTKIHGENTTIDINVDEYTSTTQDRQTTLTLIQNTTGNTLPIKITQKAKTVTLVSSVWEATYVNIDTSTISLSGETRPYTIVFTNTKTYSNGDVKTFVNNGKSINVVVETIRGTGKADVLWDDVSGWSIRFPASTSENTYKITSEYEGVTSESRTLYQGKSKTDTEYIFGIRKVEFRGSYDKDTNTMSLPSTSGKITIDFNSFTIDHFDDGSSVTNSDIIGFSYDNNSFVTNISRDSDISTLVIPENTSSERRTGSIQFTQNISGKSITIYLIQEACSIDYSIKIGSNKYGNNETYILSEFPNESSTQSLTLKPIKTVNGVDSELSGSEITISSEIHWLETSYNSNSGVLSITPNTNTSGSTRKGTFYIVYEKGNVSVPVSVTQKAGSSYITIENSTGDSIYVVSKSKESQTVTLNIESNYSYIISGSSSWVSISSGTSYLAGSSQVTFELKENTYSSERSCDFTIKNEAGTTRIIHITQSSRKDYIDIVGFENNDIVVTLSTWKKEVVLPITASKDFFVDYIGPNLSVALTSREDDSTYDATDVEFLNTGAGSVQYSKCYLHILKKNNVSNYGGELVSLSYYDSDSGTIVRGRNIMVFKREDTDILLPYGPQVFYVSGESNVITLYAYRKSSSSEEPRVTDAEVYYDGSAATSIDLPVTSKSIGDNQLEINITIPKHDLQKYREISFSLNNNATIRFSVFQYPTISLNCYYNGTSGQTKSINVSSEGQDNLEIHADISKSSFGYCEFYGNSIPGWISISEKNSMGTSFGGTPFTIRVEPNYETEARTAQLQFWCDSDSSTINTITITQEGNTSRVTRPAEYEYSLVTATTKSRYIYLYGVTDVSELKTYSSDGTKENSSYINATISKPGNSTVKLEYSIGNKNNYYHKDIYKVLNLTCEDGITRQFFIKNPRFSEKIVTINGTVNSYFNRNLSYAFTLSSNIGLTCFCKPGTHRDDNKLIEPIHSIDFTTQECSTKASNTNYRVDIVVHLEKVFHKPQIMNTLLFKNMNIAPGFTYLDNILIGAVSNSGIELIDGTGNSLESINSNYGKTTVHTLTLPSNQYNSSSIQIYIGWKFRAYDGVTVSKSGEGFNLVCYQPGASKMVGSLGYTDFLISATSSNTGTSSKYLGSVTLSIANGTQRTIQIYQAANQVNLVGKAGLTSINSSDPSYIGKWSASEANLLYKGLDTSWELTFVHEYKNWMFVDLMDKSGFVFNGKSYSGTFGNGGNSGTASSALSTKIDGCDYKSTVTLSHPTVGLLVSNNTLEMIEGGKFGLISTYGTNNITDKSNIKSTIHIYTRPDRPNVSVYNSVGTKVQDSDGTEGTGKITSIGNANVANNRVVYPITFRLMSNYIDNCKDYIGKTIKINGKSTKIETEYDVFIKLITSLDLYYKTSTDTDTSSVLPINMSSYTTGKTPDGKSYLQYSSFITIPGSTVKIASGSINITVADFVIDSSLYDALSPVSTSVPINFSNRKPLDPNHPNID